MQLSTHLTLILCAIATAGVSPAVGLPSKKADSSSSYGKDVGTDKHHGTDKAVDGAPLYVPGGYHKAESTPSEGSKGDYGRLDFSTLGHGPIYVPYAVPPGKNDGGGKAYAEKEGKPCDKKDGKPCEDEKKGAKTYYDDHDQKDDKDDKERPGRGEKKGEHAKPEQHRQRRTDQRDNKNGGGIGSTNDSSPSLVRRDGPFTDVGIDQGPAPTPGVGPTDAKPAGAEYGDTKGGHAGGRGPIDSIKKLEEKEQFDLMKKIHDKEIKAAELTFSKTIRFFYLDDEKKQLAKKKGMKKDKVAKVKGAKA